VKVGFTGILYLKEGIKLMNASIIVAIALILPPKEGPWVYIERFITLKSKSGIS
jgi:hypothetical protein